MALSLSIILTTILLIILSILYFPNIKIKNTKLGSYWVIALISAILLICLKSVSINNILNSFTANTSINPVKILILFISMTFLSIFLDEIGFFKYIALKSTTLFKSSQYKLFFGFYFLISFLTIFTSNDIIILTFTPFICYYCKNTKINPIPYLVSEFVAANTWSMTLIIGNPTNIYLSSAFGIDFIKYLSVMIFPTLATALVSLTILFLLFKKHLKDSMEIYNEENTVPNKFLLINGLAHLIITTTLLAISSYINLEMWSITLIFAISLFVTNFIYLAITKQSYKCLITTLKRAPWSLIPFVTSMFIIVLCLQEQGITNYLSSILSNSNQVFTFGFSGALAANLINNIPMSVLFANLIESNLSSIYASIIASNIAAFMTPIGALAGIMWMSLLKTYNIDFSFKKFTKYGLIIGLPSLFFALCALSLVL